MTVPEIQTSAALSRRVRGGMGAAEMKGETVSKEKHIEEAEIVVDLSGGRLAAQAYRKRIKQLQADLDKYKDALAAKFNAEMCEALKPLKAKLATAKTENERLRELREELCLIIGRGVSVARPVAYHEIIPWVREAVAIARQHGLFERKTAVEREALKEVKP